jgi:hypothetical protein
VDGRKNGVVVQNTKLEPLITMKHCQKWVDKANGAYRPAPEPGMYSTPSSPVENREIDS